MKLWNPETLEHWNIETLEQISKNQHLKQLRSSGMFVEKQKSPLTRAPERDG